MAAVLQIMTKYARLRKQVINRCGEIGIALTEKSARVGDPYKDVGAFKVNVILSDTAILLWPACNITSGICD